VRFVPFSEVRDRLRGKRVAVVGSGPSCLTNEPGFVDAHDMVVRINNYKTGREQGCRCDVFYSFFGRSIHKSIRELRNDGVTLLMNKCPDSQPIDSEWHRKNGRMQGIDFRYIFEQRAGWWWCDTFVPTDEHFRRSFNLLGQHIPTTGFTAILDVLACDPAECFITGFDFFASGVHNVNEKWRPGRADDPIGHRPERELAWLATNEGSYPITTDRVLAERLEGWRRMAA
jgi:hypothetical protein